MLKRSLAILDIVLGMVLFLAGCSKSNHDTLALVGDESDMKSCYEIYPEEYFPKEAINDTVKFGRFPPDIVGEYEMNGTFVDGHYERYNGNTHQYEEVPGYPSYKGMYIIITDQINGIANIKCAFRNHSYSEYQNWHETQAYIYGDIYSSEYSNDFIICFEITEKAGDVCDYIQGNIIKGTIGNSGIINIETWSVIKSRNPDSDVAGIYKVGSYFHFREGNAKRK